MKRIPLTRGKYAIVDDEDYEFLSQWKWRCHSGYASRIENKKHVRMHRLIMNCPQGLVVDHINRNGLDNRRENLRNCTHSENRMNSRISNSIYKGVYPVGKNKWVFKISVGGFNNAHDAAESYNKAAILIHGVYADLNIIDRQRIVEVKNRLTTE